MSVLTDTRAEASGEGWRGQAPLADLPSLLAEIQALRAQLETSIETNRTLQSKLEEQLMQPPKENPQGPAQPSPKPPQHLDEQGTAPSPHPSLLLGWEVAWVERMVVVVVKRAAGQTVP